jgi:hypothetical protein
MDVHQTIEYLRAKGLTYCARTGKLEILQSLAAYPERESVPGIFLEAGVAMGGSASVIAKVKGPGRELRLYDVFELLPPPSARDGAGARQAYDRFLGGVATNVADIAYLAHAKDLLAFAQQTLRDTGIAIETSNIAFVKGPFQDTLRLDGPVAFAHIDCDWYDSVMLCIERIADFMSPRGIMLFDDYSTFAGCREAVDGWLARDPRFRVIHSDWTLAVQRIDGPPVTTAPAPPR